LLAELAKRKEPDALREVVMGVLLKTEKVIQDQAFEIQQLRKQLFGRRSEKLSPNQLSLFAQMLGTVVGADEPIDEPAQKRKRKKALRRKLVPTESHEILVRSEERRVGKECRDRWAGSHSTNTT